MLDAIGDFVKVAVDVRKEVLAGGGALHADCEEVLLERGSLPDDVWGADWVPRTRSVKFEALINIRPRLGNRSTTLQDQALCKKVETVVRALLEGV